MLFGPKKVVCSIRFPFYHWRPRKSATSKNITGSQKLRFRRNNRSQLRFNCGLLQYENCNRLKWSTHCSWSQIVFQIIPFLSKISLWTMTFSYTNLARFGISDQMYQPVVFQKENVIWADSLFFLLIYSKRKWSIVWTCGDQKENWGKDSPRRAHSC